MHIYMRLVFGVQQEHPEEGFHFKECVCTGCMENRETRGGRETLIFKDLQRSVEATRTVCCKTHSSNLGRDKNEGNVFVRGDEQDTVREKISTRR